MKLDHLFSTSAALANAIWYANTTIGAPSQKQARGTEPHGSFHAGLVSQVVLRIGCGPAIDLGEQRRRGNAKQYSQFVPGNMKQCFVICGRQIGLSGAAEKDAQ